MVFYSEVILISVNYSLVHLSRCGELDNETPLWQKLKHTLTLHQGLQTTATGFNWNNSVKKERKRLMFQQISRQEGISWLFETTYKKFKSFSLIHTFEISTNDFGWNVPLKCKLIFQFFFYFEQTPFSCYSSKLQIVNPTNNFIRLGMSRVLWSNYHAVDYYLIGSLVIDWSVWWNSASSVWPQLPTADAFEERIY